MQGKGSGARRQLLPHVSSGPAPACGQQPCGMARAAAAGGGEGLGILLIQRRLAAMSPGQRHCGLPQAPRASARVSLARSTCSLWLCCSRCGMMQSRARSLPSRLAGTQSRGRGGGWSQRGGEEGRIRRLHPEAPPAGSAGRRRCQLHPGARGEGASALPRPQFLAGLCRSGCPSPRQCVGAPGLSLSCEPKLCNLSGIGSFPKEKQIVTNALGARASFSLPELSAFFPGLRHPNAVLPKPVRRAPRLPLPPLSPSLPLLSPPFPSLAWFTSHS